MAHRHTEDDFGLTLLMQQFHQDWRGQGSALDVLAASLWSGQNPREVAALREDALIAGSNLTDDHIGVLWLAGTEGPAPTASRPGREWLNVVAEQCDVWLVRSGQGAGAPTAGGPEFGVQVEVLREIAEVEGVFGGCVPPWALGTWEHVGWALRSCSELCTPDLAFRILLRVVSCNTLGITQEQYGRFVGLAAKFDFGKYVVKRVEPFVVV